MAYDRRDNKKEQKRGTHYKSNPRQEEKMPPLEWKTIQTFKAGRVELTLQVAHGKTRTFHSLRVSKTQQDPNKKPNPFFSPEDADDVIRTIQLAKEYLNQPVLPTAGSTQTPREAITIASAAGMSK